MTTDEILVRRATFDDYDAILNINDDIYDGRDYMPTEFHRFIQSKQHAVYVAETEHKQLVGLLLYRLHTDGRTISCMASRVREDYRQRGVLVLIDCGLRSDYPEATYRVFDGLINDRSLRTLQKCKSFYKWNVALVRLGCTIRKSDSISTVSTTGTKAILLTYPDAIAFLASGFCEKFLKRFSADFIPGPYAGCRPVRLCEEELKELLGDAYALVTLAEGQKVCNSSGPGEDGSEELIDNRADWYRQVRALSFCSSVLLKTRTKGGDVKSDMIFFGDELDDLIDHSRQHLLHLATVCGTADVHLTICFPVAVDRSSAEKQLVTSLGLEISLSTEAYLALGDYRDY